MAQNPFNQYCWNSSHLRICCLKFSFAVALSATLQITPHTHANRNRVTRRDSALSTRHSVMSRNSDFRGATPLEGVRQIFVWFQSPLRFSITTITIPLVPPINPTYLTMLRSHHGFTALTCIAAYRALHCLPLTAHRGAGIFRLGAEWEQTLSEQQPLLLAMNLTRWREPVAGRQRKTRQHRHQRRWRHCETGDGRVPCPSQFF